MAHGKTGDLTSAAACPRFGSLQCHRPRFLCPTPNLGRWRWTYTNGTRIDAIGTCATCTYAIGTHTTGNYAIGTGTAYIQSSRNNYAWTWGWCRECAFLPSGTCLYKRRGTSTSSVSLRCSIWRTPIYAAI